MRFLRLGTGGAAQKASELQHQSISRLAQRSQLHNPKFRITFDDRTGRQLLAAVAQTHQGIATSDGARFVRKFWEVIEPSRFPWRLLQSAPSTTSLYGGREDTLMWEDGYGRITEVCQQGATFRGQAAWNRRGIVVAQMSSLNATLYTGEAFDGSAVVLLPERDDDLAALWSFVASGAFVSSVRDIDTKLRVSNSTMEAVPFDVDHWRAAALEQWPGGLPQRSSDDPTQWLFRGHPRGSTEPLQVAVARLVGYRWPEQVPDDLDAFADDDGIVPLAAMPGEGGSATDRLRELLARAFGAEFSPALIDRLLAAVGGVGKTLDDWLRDAFFEQHCKAFRQRPFVWQICDGRKDGFSALIHYHRLDRQLLEKLTYTVLGNWIETQRANARSGIPAADLRLAAAEQLQRRLQLILDGEPPHDIYVRWKPLREQPLGWEPDGDDGVRVNIRPFVEAKVLRKQPNVKWGIDRGTNADSTKRDNDGHLTRDEKQAARGRS